MEATTQSPIDTTETTEDVVKNFRFGINIGKQNLLFDQHILCETALNTEVYSIPNMPEWLSGLINLRGNLVPIFLINTFLPENENIIEHNKKNIIFVINKGTDAIGLLIDKLPITLEIDEESHSIQLDTYDKVPEIFSGCINKVYALNTDIWLEIDAEILINNIRTKSFTQKT